MCENSGGVARLRMKELKGKQDAPSFEWDEKKKIPAHRMIIFFKAPRDYGECTW